jgi:hypothetical protein
MSMPHLSETERVRGNYGDYTSAPCSNCSFESVGRGFNQRFDTVIFSSVGGRRPRQKCLTLCDPCHERIDCGTLVRIWGTRILWKNDGAMREND